MHLHSNMDRLKHNAGLSRSGKIIHLHSNMDRLKPLRRAAKLTQKQHLHSNMDRLKRFRALRARVARLIYIPIWID